VLDEQAQPLLACRGELATAPLGMTLVNGWHKPQDLAVQSRHSDDPGTLIPLLIQAILYIWTKKSGPPNSVAPSDTVCIRADVLFRMRSPLNIVVEGGHLVHTRNQQPTDSPFLSNRTNRSIGLKICQKYAKIVVQNVLRYFVCSIGAPSSQGKH
jgi:hypothetical protein